MDKFLEYVEKHQNDFVERLRKAVAIPSVSGDPSYRPDVFRMADFLVDELKALGANVETRDLGKQNWHENDPRLWSL
ncbi:hypothetical protein G6F68_020920 [Rhizopus microsporus]|nr:hypothetical protein G6F68_020920 [Rhizopus microsporus]